MDPVGACVGVKGARVQNVVQELQGERIDIVPWSPDPAKYVSNALAPAEVSTVIVDEERHSLLAVVPDDQLSLAIGRQGQNVRLAARLLNWRIDVKSERNYDDMGRPGYLSLLAVDGIDEEEADKLTAAGLDSAAKLATAPLAELAEIISVDEDQAALMKLQAAGFAEAKETKTAAPPQNTADNSSGQQDVDDEFNSEE